MLVLNLIKLKSLLHHVFLKITANFNIIFLYVCIKIFQSAVQKVVYLYLFVLFISN